LRPVLCYLATGVRIGCVFRLPDRLSARQIVDEVAVGVGDQMPVPLDRQLDAGMPHLLSYIGNFHLPRQYFEYAFESWKKMRSARDFNADQYAEWPQDGRSHIRSQLLWDFFSLLNHAIAGYDKTSWGSQDSETEERAAYAFIKERKFEDLSDQELVQLDGLADLLEQDPGQTELVIFYRNNEAFRLKTAENDPHSFVFNP